MGAVTIVLSSILCLFAVYQLIYFRVAYLERQADHSDRNEFLNDPKVYRMPFLAEIIKESMRIKSEGVAMPAFARWIEQTYWYRMLTLSSTNLQIGAGVLLVIAMYLFYRFMLEKYQTDRLEERASRLASAMNEQNTFLQQVRDAEALAAHKRYTKQQQKQYSDEIPTGFGAATTTTPKSKKVSAPAEREEQKQLHVE